MKRNFFLVTITIIFSAIVLLLTTAFAHQSKQKGYILEHEKDVIKNEPGPHEGGGNTTVNNFFAKDKDVKVAFRKRALHPGSSIGYHLQKEEEVYYILGGVGKMNMNGEIFTVHAGDAILTHPGSSHGLKQEGKEDLVLIITYRLP
jgi:mannose-6-phosphate isomerase-like protein (cupin superfamily)